MSEETTYDYNEFIEEFKSLLLELSNHGESESLQYTNDYLYENEPFNLSIRTDKSKKDKTEFLVNISDYRNNSIEILYIKNSESSTLNGHAINLSKGERSEFMEERKNTFIDIIHFLKKVKEDAGL